MHDETGHAAASAQPCTMCAPAAKRGVGNLHHGQYGLCSATTIRCGKILISKYGIRLTTCGLGNDRNFSCISLHNMQCILLLSPRVFAKLWTS